MTLDALGMVETKGLVGAIEAALKVYKPTEQPVLINSIMARPERFEKIFSSNIADLTHSKHAN